MKEAYRGLRPGGRLLFSEAHPIYSVLERISRNGAKLSILGYMKKNGKYETFGDCFGHNARVIS